MEVRWDPFARQSLERVCFAQDGNHSCSWCGQLPARLYSYNGLGWFCNLSCFDSYHN